jgi:hypothetical protein
MTSDFAPGALPDGVRPLVSERVGGRPLNTDVSVRRRPVAVRAGRRPIGYLLSVWEGSSPNSRR